MKSSCCKTPAQTVRGVGGGERERLKSGPSRNATGLVSALFLCLLSTSFVYLFLFSLSVCLSLFLCLSLNADFVRF